MASKKLCKTRENQKVSRATSGPTPCLFGVYGRTNRTKFGHNLFFRYRTIELMAYKRTTAKKAIRKYVRKTLVPRSMFKSQAVSYQKKTELKRVDNGNSSFLITSTPTIIALNIMRMGTDDYQRVGKEICMKFGELIASVWVSGARTNVNDFMRYAIVYDRQTNGALPTYGDIFKSTDLNGGIITDPYSHVNEDQKDRFLVLLDKQWGIPSDNPSALSELAASIGGPYPSKIRHHINLKNLAVRFLSDGPTIASISSGSLLLVAMGLNANAAANFSMTFNFRTCYSDI